MFNKIAWIGWGLTIAGILVAAPIVLGRGNPALSRSRDTISAMSDVERNVLKRKYELYRTLTEVERDELRQLHSQLEQDRSKGPRYLDAMRLYCDWLKTIDAWQQDDLAHISQPQEKVQRVASIVKERSDAEDSEAEARPGAGPLQAARLNEQQLSKVFDYLTRRLTLTAEEQQQVDKLQGLKRFGYQLRLLREQGGQNPEKALRTLSEAELAQMVEETGNADLKQFFSGPIDIEKRKRFVVRAIFISCMDQLSREAASVSEDKLRAHLATLPPEQQDQLLQLRADQFKARLLRSYLLADSDVAELRSLIDREINAARKRLQGGPPGDGPNGEGRGPRGDGPKGMRGILGRQLGKNRLPDPNDREPPPEGPPPGGPRPEFGPDGEPPPPRP
ncbi:MAG: hypothetical protein DWH81_13485 [Planctomycetota bacterium]|nr:MAG: hypothetical protein DWH81_13485 [Planctomycetota bacterium]